MLLPAPPAQVQQAPLPAWWQAFLKAPGLHSAFRQESGSAVFGSLVKTGSLQAARGGKLRVAYDEGLLLVSGGRTLVQYDPDTRSAQRFDLRAARTEIPLLGLLLDPGSLGEHFAVQAAGPGKLRLKPRRAGLPEVELEGRGAAPTVIRWIDPSGAKQVLRLEGTPAPGPKDPFRFDPPPGTRWVGGDPKGN